MRIDKYLYENSMAKSRTHAHSLIISGLVRCDGRIVMRPSFEVSGSEKIEISGDVCPYVSRGGLKLEYALDEFGINPSGKTAVDIGASTGGFTDVLLRRGAKRVYALDSGHGQLDAKIASDPRVKRVLESLSKTGFFVLGLIKSPIKGGDGNTEYLVWASRREGTEISDARIRRTVCEENSNTAKER